MTPLALAPRRLLVIAPHPDDEALGCGGMIAAFRQDGRDVRVVFITDGGASHRGSRTWPRDRLAAERRREALAALRILGVGADEAIFLDLPDAGMPAFRTPAWTEARRSLASTVQAFAPDLVLIPWRRDPHRDHRDAWALTSSALETGSRRPETLEYAVWLDELGSDGDHPQPGEAERVAFDIAEWLHLKRAALQAHRTQTTDLIDDDPDGFRLSAATLERLVAPEERYWRSLL